MNFGQAQEEMRQGKRVARYDWAINRCWIQLQRPDAHSKMTEPYAFHADDFGVRVPWVPTQQDLWSLDWFILPEQVA
jgi:hypothetical protein